MNIFETFGQILLLILLLGLAIAIIGFAIAVAIVVIRSALRFQPVRKDPQAPHPDITAYEQRNPGV